jgi:hypothetical protein
MEADGNTSQPVEASKIRNDRMRGDEPEDRSAFLQWSRYAQRTENIFRV